MVIHCTLSAVSATNAAYWTAPATHPATGAEVIRYVDFVGQRLIKKVRITVNGNPLDEYGSDVECFHNKYFVTPNKRIGWNRNVGMENPIQGYSDVTVAASGLYGRGAGIRQGVEFFNGPQTEKPTQPALDMWIPLLFWFKIGPQKATQSVRLVIHEYIKTTPLGACVAKPPNRSGTSLEPMLPFSMS